MKRMCGDYSGIACPAPTSSPIQNHSHHLSPHTLPRMCSALWPAHRHLDTSLTYGQRPGARRSGDVRRGARERGEEVKCKIRAVPVREEGRNEKGKRQLILSCVILLAERINQSAGEKCGTIALLDLLSVFG